MASVGKLDKLTRSFLTETSSPFLAFDSFKDLQDPTYMSFKLNFFPHMGKGFLNDAYSAAGLFREPGLKSGDYAYFRDSAHEYLGNIGSPTRQAYLRAFTNLLYRIQNEAPWYFQSISGLGDVYKIDPAINFRAKDKVLTVECLESIDMRMSYLADLYRNMAFDMENMREILPVNLRSFNMEVYVLEFRRFNTTWGIVADALASNSGSPRGLSGEELQKLAIGRNERNVYKTDLGAGLFNNFIGIGGQLSDIFGGIGGLFGSSGTPIKDIQSAFEAISIQVFSLQDCEFDFFSESPVYYDTVSVADNSTPATTKFKIKVGKIQKIGLYPFHKFVIGEHIRNTMFNAAYVKNRLPSGVTDPGTNWGTPYIEATEIKDLMESSILSLCRDYRETIYPTDSINPLMADSEAYRAARDESDRLRRKPLERMLGNVLKNSTNFINDTLEEKLKELTGGLIGESPLGNIYGRQALVDRIRQGISDFFTPGGQSPYKPPQQVKQILGNILEKPKEHSPFVKEDIITDIREPKTWRKNNVYQKD